MSTESTENTVLIAFARAASKAQEIEALLKETLISVEVANDARDGRIRSFSEIAEDIGKLTLGALKRRYLETVRSYIDDPNFPKMWNEINAERIFLMHYFFNEFPIKELNRNRLAAQRLQQIDRLLDMGCRMLREVFDRTSVRFGIPREEWRDFLKFVVDYRKKIGTTSELQE